jgi:hypothetical protein
MRSITLAKVVAWAPTSVVGTAADLDDARERAVRVSDA